MKKYLFLPICICIFLMFIPLLGSIAKDTEQKKQSDQQNIDKYIKEWLNSPIRYIITKKEAKAYKKLKDRKEKLRFINYFWMRRDTNPKTPANEFRDEFYKRVAESNRFFARGKKEGWKSDRGQIYIILGPPQEKQTGVTRNVSGPPPYPGEETKRITPDMLRYEVWTYHSLPSRKIPSMYSITFIDWYGNLDYRLDSGNFSGKGEFELEMDKRFYTPRSGFMPKELGAGIEDIIESAIVNKELKLKDVPINAKTQFPLPFRLYRTCFQADKSEVQMLVGINFRYGDIIFKKNEEKKLFASLAIEGLLRDENNTQIDSFKQNPIFSLQPQQLEEKSYESFFFWQSLQAKPGKYFLSIRAEDQNSGAQSVWEKEVTLPPFKDKELKIGEIILANDIISPPQSEPIEGAINTLCIMDHQISPNMDGIYYEGSKICLFFQLLNLQLDKETSLPLAKIKFYIYKDNKVFRIYNPPDTSFTFRKPDMVLTSYCIPLADFPDGEYALSIIAIDKIANKDCSHRLQFKVMAKNP